MRLLKWAVSPALAAGLLAVSPAPEADAASLSTDACLSRTERKAIQPGTRKATVRGWAGTKGQRVSRSGRVEVRRYPACNGARVLVKYRGQRVISRWSERPTVAPQVSRSDMDGNGTVDYLYDSDRDGYYETVLFDDDANGVFETISLDIGTTSGLFKDQNQDGYFELVLIDADRDGRGERLFYDRDQDGYPELQCLDLIGPDGMADTWVDTRVSSGNASQDRAASDLMVQNIVHLNQLRQLNPWSTGYIPYNPAPSLLR